MNDFGNNVKKAAKFGTLIEISEDPLNGFSVDRLAWTLAPALNRFDADDDYLLLTGPGSAYIVAGVLLFSRFDSINCLRFDNAKQQYVPLRISRPEIERITPSKPPGRIFVLNYSGHVINQALTFSDLPPEDKVVILTRGNVNQFDIDNLEREICFGRNDSAGLNEFRNGDMLLLSGPGVAHMIAAAAFVAMGQDISLLLFGPRTQSYLKREISLNDMLETAAMAEA
jgi:hypothetical protein